MSASQIAESSTGAGADAASAGGRGTGTATAGGGSDAFSHLLPALTGGARGLRDPVSFLTIGVVLVLTLVPGLVIVGAMALQGLASAVQITGPGSFGQAGTPGVAGIAGVMGLLVVLVVIALTWSWMAVSVRASSLARGEPLGTWQSVITGLKRWFVAVGALLSLLVLPLALLVVHFASRAMAGIMVLSIVSLVLTLAVMVAVFLAVLALLLGLWFVPAFAAADLRAGVGQVLRRTLRLATSNPGAMALLVIVTLYVSGLIVQVLSLPALAALGAGFDIGTVAAVEGRGVTSGLMFGVLVLFVLVLLLIPVVFVASTLVHFVVRLGPAQEDAGIAAMLAGLRTGPRGSGRASTTTGQGGAEHTGRVEAGMWAAPQPRQAPDRARTSLEDLPPPDASQLTPERDDRGGPDTATAAEDPARRWPAPATSSLAPDQPDPPNQERDLSAFGPPDESRRAD